MTAAGMPAAAMPAMPAAASPPQGYAQNGVPPTRPGFGQAPPGYGQQPPQQAPMFGAAPQQQGYGQAQRPFGQGAPPPNERTAAIQSPGDDLGATVALPVNAQGEFERPRPGGGQQPFSPYGQPQQGAPPGFNQPPPSFNQPPPGFNGQGGYGAPPQQQQFAGFGQQGMPQQQQQLQQLQQHMQQQFPGMPAQSGIPGHAAPQSQIETALSLPRPDPAALWLAQQEKQRGDRKNTGVLIAVVALTALCVIGIGALVYFKLRAGGATPASSTTPETPAASAAPTASASAAASASASAVVEAAPAPSVTASASASASAAPAVAGPSTGAPASGGVIAKGTGTAAPKDSASKDKDEPGFLTIVCNP